jgi:hypothetical protein
MGFVRDHLKEDSEAAGKVSITSQISAEERRILYVRPDAVNRRPTLVRTAILMLLSAAFGFLLALMLF